MSNYCCSAPARDVLQVDETIQLTKSVATICEFLDSRISKMPSLEFFKRTVSVAITEELKLIIHQSVNEIRSDDKAEVEELQKKLREKDAHIRDLEQIIFELQTFYRTQSDLIKQRSETHDVASHDHDFDTIEETSKMEKKKSVFASLFKPKQPKTLVHNDNALDADTNTSKI
mmetsp:Transcript_21338/g.29354  ORF Transcript_21338/g.29354 Transcript_21338/m.29354 type:complete len:173 (+) Transcript_21338:127-645(+)